MHFRVQGRLDIQDAGRVAAQIVDKIIAMMDKKRYENRCRKLCFCSVSLTKATRQLTKIGLKIDTKNRRKIDSTGRPRLPESTPKWSPEGSRGEPEKSSEFTPLWTPLGRVFGRSWGPTWPPRAGLGAQLGPQDDPKSDAESSTKSIIF